jgi:ferric-chelate reductase [NAD(P)H]
VDKLAKVEYRNGVTGCPLIIQHALSVLEARVFDEIDLGTHNIFIADTVNSRVLREGRPLTYRFYHEKLRGKSSPNAPTYTPDTGRISTVSPSCRSNVRDLWPAVIPTWQPI